MTVCLLVRGELYDGTPCKGGGCECDNFSNHLRKNLRDMVFWVVVLPWAEVGNRDGAIWESLYTKRWLHSFAITKYVPSSSRNSLTKMFI